MDAWFLYSKEAMHPNFLSYPCYFLPFYFLPCYSYCFAPLYSQKLLT